MITAHTASRSEVHHSTGHYHYIVAWGQDAFRPSYEKRSDVQDGVWAAWYSYFAQDNPDPPDDARTVLAKLASTIIQSGDNNYRNYR
ncbi:hypothetical protein RDE2_50440 (plasmid) [Rhodococcus sp. RDE2]|nr:hypothetical protein RDE2_50440 [Rhodococcus sp. RDE2]